MSAIEIMYIVFLVWSLAFGFEAMLIGLGERVVVLYRKAKAKTLGMAAAIGLTIVFLAITTSFIYSLQPIYFAVTALSYSLIASGLIHFFWPAKVQTKVSLPTVEGFSDEDIEEIVRRRGLGRLIAQKKRKSSKK